MEIQQSTEVENEFSEGDGETGLQKPKEANPDHYKFRPVDLGLDGQPVPDPEKK